MKRLILAAWLLFPAFVSAADFTANTKTLNDQSYNKAWRDVKDGTNAETFDNVYANDFAKTSAITNTIKATGGYLHSVILGNLCTGATAYVIADAAAGAASYATVITTISTPSSAPLVIPINARTSNGIAISVMYSTCTVTAIYR